MSIVRCELIAIVSVGRASLRVTLAAGLRIDQRCSPRIALEWRSDSGVEQSRRTQRRCAEATPNRIAGLDGAALPVIRELEQTQLALVAQSARGDAKKPNPLSAHLAPGQLDRSAPDDVHQVGRLPEGPLAGDGRE